MRKLVLILFLILNSYAFSQVTINKIYLDQRDVFDSTQSDWFFAAPVVNFFHIMTKPYVIADELLFQEGDELDLDLIYETERNLRSKGIFTKVDILFDTLDNKTVDVWIVAQDRWTTQLDILIGTGGNEESYGLKLDEKNFLGSASKINFEALHRSENNIGWQASVGLLSEKVFRSDYTIDLSIIANRYKTEQNLTFYEPFSTFADNKSYGINGRNVFGNEFTYRSDSILLLPIHERKIAAWYSQAWIRKDKVFITLFTEFDDVKRSISDYRRAYDNTAKVLLAFSSLSEKYIKTSKLNTFLQEDLPIGGWGTTILGKTFSMKSGGEALYYIGGRGETSWFYDDLYLFGQITGASSFTNNRGKYTYQEFLGLGFYQFSKDILIAGRFRQQTVWNWEAYRQLVLDNDGGLRGYRANRFAGDNRIVCNFEVRAFPDIDLWILRLGPTLFFDTGTVWDRGTDIVDTRWYSSVGAGLRIFNMKASGKSGILRIDFAYNLDKMKFAEIIFTSDQLFSIYKTHQYELPEVYGMEFDFE